MRRTLSVVAAANDSAEMPRTARNSPVFLPQIGVLLASVRGMTAESFAAATTDNVRRIIGA